MNEVCFHTTLMQYMQCRLSCLRCSDSVDSGGTIGTIRDSSGVVAIALLTYTIGVWHLVVII